MYVIERNGQFLARDGGWMSILERGVRTYDNRATAEVAADRLSTWAENRQVARVVKLHGGHLPES